MGTTYGPEALPIPQPTDAPDGPGAFLALVQQMVTGGPYAQDTLAHLQALPGKYLNQKGVVYNDTANPQNNGEYLWSGSAWIFYLPFVVPTARVTRTAAFSTPATGGQYVAIPWDTDVINTGAVLPHSTSSNPSRFTAPIPGVYRIRGTARINVTTTSGNAQIAKNGVATTDTLYALTPASGTTPFVIAEDTVQMAAGDYVEFWVTSANASIPVSNASCSFMFLHS